MIEVRRVSFSYRSGPALRDVSIDVRPGELLAITGPNGSGKSTLAKVMNGLLLPDSGECAVDGVSTRDDPLRSRRLAGLVFQEPEDQAVARRVADDLAFGPRNLGVDDVTERVEEALRLIGIEGFAGRSVHGLSGGQRQLVAIAGVLAMRPAYLVMDEPTALLDSEGAAMVAAVIAKLKRDGMGIVAITQDPAIAASADRVAVMSGGRIVAQGAPRAIFSNSPEGLAELPEMARLLNRLQEKGFRAEGTWLVVDDALEGLCR